MHNVYSLRTFTVYLLYVSVSHSLYQVELLCPLFKLYGATQQLTMVCIVVTNTLLSVTQETLLKQATGSSYWLYIHETQRDEHTLS